MGFHFEGLNGHLTDDLILYRGLNVGMIMEYMNDFYLPTPYLVVFVVVHIISG